VAVCRDEDVLRLEVAECGEWSLSGRHADGESEQARERVRAPVDDAGAVQASDAVDDLADVEARTVASEPAPASELRREVAAGVKVESEVERCERTRNGING